MDGWLVGTTGRIRSRKVWKSPPRCYIRGARARGPGRAPTPPIQTYPDFSRLFQTFAAVPTPASLSSRRRPPPQGQLPIGTPAPYHGEAAGWGAKVKPGH
eukprot:5542331-Prymnesium_polylepis.1